MEGRRREEIEREWRVVEGKGEEGGEEELSFSPVPNLPLHHCIDGTKAIRL